MRRDGAAATAGVWAASVAAAEDGVECDGRSDFYGGLDCVFCGVADGAVGFVTVTVVLGTDAVGVEFLGEVPGVAVGAFGLSFGRGVGAGWFGVEVALEGCWTVVRVVHGVHGECCVVLCCVVFRLDLEHDVEG